MPWCEGCERFLNPNTLHSDGTCPTCDTQVATAEELEAAKLHAVPKTPWHFKLLVAATVLYLIIRFVQMVGWVVT